MSFALYVPVPCFLTPKTLVKSRNIYLRPTAKTWMAKTGTRTAVAMEFMGHKKRTVHDGYDNVDADDLRAAAETLRTDRLLAFVAKAKPS